MKKIIFTWLICMIGVMSAEAQLSFNRENRKGNSNKQQTASTKRLLKDPHWKQSEYKPTSTKKEQREVKKNTRELQALSYSKEKSPYYNKKDAREAKAIKKRQERVKGVKATQNDRKGNLIQKDSGKKYQKTQKMRTQKVNQNKRNYGTRASRKSPTNIVEMLSPRPKFYN